MRRFLTYAAILLLIIVSGYILIEQHSTERYTAVASSSNKVHILIVPGHEPDYGGAHFNSQYGTVYERDLTVELGQDLQQFLDNNGNYQVNITRDTNAWNPIFADYFNNNWNSIVSWVNAAKNSSSSIPSVDTEDPEIHNSDPVDVALRLFGITKWSNENNVDLMIHIHFNDYPGHPADIAGKYSGLVMYIPAAQYGNSSTTGPIAQAVFRRLTLYNPISDLKVESGGIIDDPELIATGADNTSKAASMLIEYEYIYQPELTNPKVRSLALKDFAYQTYLGLQDYFTQNNGVSAEDQYNPSLLYAWNGLGMNKDSSNPEDIYALQTSLIMDGDYPPAGKTKNDCPHSGIFGTCTFEALQAFQDKNGITGEDGTVGSKSFAILNKIYSGKAF